MDILQSLNDEQMEAVTTTEGYVRVIAGAGSGKTKALTHRYAYLVRELGISPSDILCVTFTNKAANEMKKRIRKMIGDSDTGFVCTFHGFCVQLLREDIHVIHYPEKFMVMDEDDAETILKKVYEDSKISSKTYTFDMARDLICARKVNDTLERKYRYIRQMAELSNEGLKQLYDTAKDIKDKIYFGYLYEQKKCYALDYDDLITVALYILRTDDEKRKKWQEKMMYVMVDEFQDVSRLNYDLAEILSGYHKNLFIVGDPDQTIYSWRGANVEYILGFDKQFPDVKTIFLNKNYRSSPEILNASNSLIEKNKNRIEKQLVATCEKNVPAIFFHAKTTKLEADWIAAQIEQLVEKGKTYSDVAVLYRSHFVSRSVEEAFLNRKIPYILYSGVEFYRRKEIKDILAYLRMLIHADDLSFQRVVNEPRRNIGKKRMEFLKEYAKANDVSLYKALTDHLEDDMFGNTKAAEFVALVETYRNKYEAMSVSDLMAEVLDRSGYEAMLREQGEQERLDNLSELKQSIYEYEKTAGEECSLSDYLQSIALFTNSDRDEKRAAVKMMTIHTAKGLEFPYVFVCGLNEGVFPSKHVETKEQLEEERRMAYVAYTRAERALFLSDAEGVNFDGGFRFPSRFIFNTDKAFLDYAVELEERLKEDSVRYIEENETRIGVRQIGFNVGDKVNHKVFGPGEIVEVRQEQAVLVIKFQKFETVRNLSFDAPITKE